VIESPDLALTAAGAAALYSTIWLIQNSMDQKKKDY
jgi:hypothetical protein